MNLIKLTLASIIFVMSFAMQSSEVKAQCEDGYNFYSFQILYPNSNCIIDISFCYRCSTFGPSPISTIKNINWSYSNPNSTCPEGDLYEWVISEIVSRYYDLCNVPPCDEGNATFTVEMPLCIFAKNILYPHQDGTMHNLTFKYSCETDFSCIWTYEICYNPITDEYEIDNIQKFESGSPACPLVMPTLPPPGFTYDDEWESDCWQGRQCTIFVE